MGVAGSCLSAPDKTERFYVGVLLFSNRSQKKSKCGKSISDTFTTFLFLPHFDVICDLLLNRRTATWNLFVKQATNPKELFHSFYPGVSAGVHPLLNKPDDSGLEIGYEVTSGSLFLPYWVLE